MAQALCAYICGSCLLKSVVVINVQIRYVFEHLCLREVVERSVVKLCSPGNLPFCSLVKSGTEASSYS